MIQIPTKFKIVTGAAEGKTKLTAFDHALMKAGIANINLVRISSILPPGAVKDQDMLLKPGTLAPTAYGSIVSDKPGTKIAAAVGVGYSYDTFGVIMEFSGECDDKEARQQIEKMIKEAFELRGMQLKDMDIEAVELEVKEIGAAVAAVVLGY